MLPQQGPGMAKEDVRVAEKYCSASFSPYSLHSCALPSNMDTRHCYPPIHYWNHSGYLLLKPIGHDFLAFLHLGASPRSPPIPLAFEHCFPFPLIVFGSYVINIGRFHST